MSDNNLKKLQFLLPISLILIAFINMIISINNHWVDINNWLLPDSDDAMRVLEVRDWLNGQAYYDLLNHRANPPWGSEMHWSRLSDAPLAITELLLKPFFGNEIGEKLGVYITPLWLGLIFIFVGTLAVKKYYKSNFTILMFVATCLLTEMIAFTFQAGRVDHHGLQLICLMLIILGFNKVDFNGGLIFGFSLSASLTIGFELLPLEIMSVFLLVLAWLVSSENRKPQILGFCASLAIGIMFGFIINVGPNSYFNVDNDRLSVAQVVIILLGTIPLYFVAKTQSTKPIKNRLLYLIFITIIVAICTLSFQDLLKPLYWQISPIFRKLWFNDVGETFPLKIMPLFLQVAMGAFASIATLSSTIMTIKQFATGGKKNQDIDFQKWLFITILLALSTILMFVYQARFITQVSALAAIASSAIIGKIFDKRSLIYALAAFIILSPSAPSLLIAPLKKLDDKSKRSYDFGVPANCRSIPDFKHLAGLPKGIVATDISMGIETLLSTHHDVVATHFHRDKGRNVAYDIFLANPDIAMEKIKKANIDYIAFCPMHTEIGHISDYAPNSLMANLNKGKLPQYLTEIKATNNSDIKVFKLNKSNKD